MKKINDYLLSSLKNKKRLAIFIGGAVVLVGVFSLLSLSSLNLVRDYVHQRADQGQHRHEAVAAAALKVLERDVSDLELQLERSLGRKDSLKGQFNIFPGKNGLRATHTEVPASPIEIEAPKGSAPFAEALHIDTAVEFLVYNDEGTLLSDDGKFSNDLLFYFSNVVRGVETAKSQWGELVEGAKIVPTAKNYQPSLRQWLSSRSFVHLKMEPVHGSNLVVVSVMKFSSMARALFAMVRPALFALAFMFFALLMFAGVKLKTRKRAVARLSDQMKKFRYGRLDAPSDQNAVLYGFDQAVFKEMTRQFSVHSPFSPFYAGKWLDADRRLATWIHFTDTLSVWGMQKQSVRQESTKQNWFVGRLQIGKPSGMHTAIKTLGRVFEGSEYLLNHYDECELWVAARVEHFDEWVEKMNGATRALVYLETLAAGQVIFNGLYVQPERRYLADEVVSTLKALPELSKLGEPTLTKPVLRYFEAEKPGTPVLDINWLQILSIPSAEFERYISPQLHSVMTYQRPLTPPPPAPAPAAAPVVVEFPKAPIAAAGANLPSETPAPSLLAARRPKLPPPPRDRALALKEAMVDARVQGVSQAPVTQKFRVPRIKFDLKKLTRTHSKVRNGVHVVRSRIKVEQSASTAQQSVLLARPDLSSKE